MNPIAEGSRKTNIEIVGNVPWGTHFCMFYESKEDLAEILTPYFKAGLENNEFCMCVTSDPMNKNDAIGFFSENIHGFDSYVQKGQMEILDYSEWYTAGAGFESSRVMQGWVDKLNRARAAGYDGLRLSGNTFWLEDKDWKNFTDYEEQVNRMIGNYNIMALCTYSLQKCNAAEIMDVVSNHGFSMIKRGVKWEIVKSSSVQNAADEARASTEKYKALFSNMPDGAAYHRIILDEAGKPADYVFLELNRAFEEMTGLKKEAVLNRKVSEVIPGIKDDPADLIAAYGKVALTGKPLKLEIYFRPLERWYSITAYSPEKMYFAAVFEDITDKFRAERAIEENREDLNRAQAVAHTGSWRLDTRGNELVWSDEVYRIFGIPVGESMTYEKFMRAVHPDDRDYVDAKWQAALKGRPYDVEHRIIAGGKVKWVKEKAVLETNKKGEMTGGFGTVQDITEHKRIDESLRQSEKRFKMIIDNSPLSISSQDKKLRYTWIYNSRYYPKPENYIGKADSELVDASTAAKLTKLKKSVMRTRRPARGEIRIKKGGVESIFDVMVRPITGPGGGIEGVTNLAIDVTEKRKAEEKISWLSSFPGKNPNPITEIDSNGKVTYMNAAFKRMFPEAAKQPLKHPWFKGIKAFFWALRGKKEEIFSREVAAGDGFFMQSMVYMPVGSTMRTYGMDITKRKKAENELKRLYEKMEIKVEQRTAELLAAKHLADIGTLAATVAHELRNPLGVINVAAYNLKKKSKDRGLIKHIDNIEKKVAEGGQIINNLLVYSRMKLPQFEKTDIHRLLSECAIAAKKHFGGKKIRLVTSLKHVKGLFVDADALQLKEVYNNIITNAFQALEGKKGIVEIKAAVKKGGQLIVGVRDTGIGIGKDDMNNIFKPFFTRKTKGTGLGLVICRDLINMHNGSICIKSRPGKGSTFTVIMPIRRS